MSLLTFLGNHYGTDKATDLGGHAYTEIYESLLGDSRYHVNQVLEIGSYRGASLKMWHDYFPRATVIGLDREPVDPGIDQDAFPRIRLILGDVRDPAVIARIREIAPFDLIIDDGSHLKEEIDSALSSFFPLLEPGGLYAIEDYGPTGPGNWLWLCRR